MIKVDDLTGTVTMSLKDYEKMRDRENIFEQDKAKYEEGLIQDVYEYSCDPGVSTTASTWIYKEDLFTKQREQYRQQEKATNMYRDNLKKVWEMSLSEFKEYKKRFHWYDP